MLGKWHISTFVPASLTSDSALTIKEALALFLMDGDMRPAMLTATKGELTLHVVGGDSAVLSYTLVNAEDDRYNLLTEEGEGVFVIENTKKAHLNIGGATYALYR